MKIISKIIQKLPPDEITLTNTVAHLLDELMKVRIPVLQESVETGGERAPVQIPSLYTQRGE